MVKDALETRTRSKISADLLVLSRYEVRHDGKKPYERLRGKQSRLLGLKFGELLRFRRHQAAGKLVKLEVSWEDGYRTLSGERVSTAHRRV